MGLLALILALLALGVTIYGRYKTFPWESAEEEAQP